MKLRPLLLLALCLLPGCMPVAEVTLKEDVARARCEQRSKADGVSTVVLLERLMSASPGALATMDASQPAAPGLPRAAVHHALWLATPGHAGHDPAAARRLLEQVLTSNAPLPQTTAAIAHWQLHYLQELARARRARSELERTNARLREKIEALTVLEQKLDGGQLSGESGS